MSREIDERIVAMYFDNEQFEKNARQSMKTLDELKQGLDFEGVGESFQQVQKMTSKGFGMKDSTKQVSFFSKALTGMGKAAKSAFNVATMPIQALGNGLKTLEGYVGKVLGFNLASKLVNTGETVIRAFTIDPMRSGWNEYELKMDSIKTIMSGTTEEFKKQMGAAYTESAHLEAVKDALEQLNKYADQTVYSFSDMTSNIGKFTNNGVKLEDAVMAMKGISNAAAQAGQGTQQASMAMYNLSQAISVGKLTTMDWKSIENANMATQQFKQTFIDMAAAMGKLEKKGDQYFTTTKKHMEVTAENFRNTLSEGWADSDVITAALKVWSGDYKAVQLVELGVPEELAWEMERLGQAAFDAATQVRTFTKMWDALKEAAQSGWSMSWEYIFGDMNEATEMWTNFNNRFSGWLESSAKARNDLLKGWRGEIVESDIGEALNDTLVEWDKYEYKDWYKEGGLETLASAILEDFKKNNGDIDKAIEHIRKQYGLTAEDAREAAMKVSDVLESGALGYVGTDGRSTLIAGINNLLDGFENVGRLFGKIKTAVFGEMTPELLQNLTQGFANLTERFKNFTVELGSGKVFKNITTGLKGVASLFTMLWNSIKSIGSFALKMLSPVGEFFSDLFAGIGEWLTSLSGGGIVTAIKKIVDGFKNLTKVKVADWFKKAATSVGNLFKNLGGKASGWFKENGFEKVGDMIANATSSISSAWNRVIGWKGWSDIGAFFSDALGWIVKTYGKAKSAVISLFGKGEDGGPSAVAKAVSDAYAVIENAWNGVFGEGGKGKEIIDKIGNFFVNTYHSIISLFTPIEGANGEQEPSPAMAFLTNVGTTLENAWKAAFGEGSKGKEIIDKIGNFFVNTYHSIVALFTPIEGANGETEPSPAMAFLTNVGTTLETAWNGVFGEGGKGKEIIDKIGNFFVNTYRSIISLFTPIEGANGEKEPSPAMAFLTDVGTTLETAWNGVFGEGGKGKEIIDKIGNFFVNTYNSIISMFTPDDTTNTPDADTEGPSAIAAFLNGALTTLDSAWESLWGFLEKTGPQIGEFITDALGFIIGLAVPSAKAEDAGESVVEAIPTVTSENVADVSEKLSLFDQFIETINGFVSSVRGWSGWKEIGSVLKALFDGFTGVVSSIVTVSNIERTRDLLIRTFELILSILEKAVEFAGKLADGDKSSWMFLIAGWLAKVGTEAALPDVSPLNSFAMQLLEFAGAIALVAGAVAVLGNMDEWALVKGLLGIAAIAGAIIFVAPKLKALTDSKTALEEAASPTAGWEKVAGGFVKWVGIMGALKVVMSALPDLVTAIGSSGVESGQIFEALTGITILISGLSLVAGVMSKLNINAGAIVKTSAAIALTMPIMAAGLISAVSAIGGLFMGLDPGSATIMLDNFVSFMNKLGEAFGGLVGTYKGTKQANQAGAALVGIGKFAEVADTIDEEKVAKFKRMMEMVKAISESIPVENTIWQKLFGGGSMSPDALNEFLSGLGLGISSFVNQTKELDDGGLAQADRAAEFLKKMLTVGNLSKMLEDFDADNAWGVLEFMKVLGQQGDQNLYEGYDGVADAVSKMASFADTINQSIIDAAPEVDVAPLIDAIANGISGADSQSILKNAFASLGTLLSGEGVELPTASVGGGDLFSGLFSMLDTFNVNDYTEQLNGMLGDFNPEELTNKLGLGDIFDMSDEGLSGQINAMMTSMQEQLNSGEYSLGVQMVPEWSDGEPPAWWNGNAPMDIKGEVTIGITSLTTITSGLTSIQTAIDTQGNSIVSALGSLAEHVDGLASNIDNISSSIADMQLVLDTGAIAGAVDKALGKKAAIESRAGGGGR